MRLFAPALFLVILAVSAFGQGASTNTVVRFRISHGSALFGDLDVELYDADKPVTVSNFLFYARSGAYNNSIIHRLIPGFIVQGGASTVANPYSLSPVASFSEIPTNSPIANEANEGPFLSNAFGTLAMALKGADANSAQTSWFINLTNNTRLDTVATNGQGPYTVFGRVISGSQVLQRFNADPSREFEILHGSFGDLPVARTRSSFTRLVDLFTVQVLMMRGSDLVQPAVRVTFPPSNLVVSNDTLTVTGTASDLVGVARVEVFLGATNPAVVADGTNSWSATLTHIPPGTNVITVVSTDTSGTKSVPVTRTIFRSVRAPFSLEVEGAGTISGPTNGQLLELTRNYTLTAKPAALNLFAGWSGAVNSRSSTVRFTMETGTAIVGTFATNHFPGVKGVYRGLFQDTNGIALDNSGFLTLTLGSLGAYSGQLLSAGKAFSFSGVVDPFGQACQEVRRPQADSLFLCLQVDLVSGSDSIKGLISPSSSFDRDTNGTWVASLIADRAVFSSRSNPASLAGSYTALLPSGSNSSAPTVGDGFGRVTVSRAGTITFSGMLADGTKLTRAAPVSKFGNWPFYIPLYRGGGSVVGWVDFADLPGTDFRGALAWFKQALPGAAYYASGLSNSLICLGSRYVPGATNPVIVPAPSILGFTNGNLEAGFSVPVEWTAANQVLDANGRRVLTLAKPAGLFAGSVVAPGRTVAIPFKGAVLQKQHRGAGFFLGTNESGRVSLGE